MPLVHLLFGLSFVVVLGYFVLLSSERAEGRLKTFGRILATWLFVLPVLALIAAAAHGHRGGWHDGWHGMHRGPMPGYQQAPNDAPPLPPLPANAPAAPDAGAAPPGK
jgi:hypothetical protein